jgi:hypothetical protein
MPLLFDEDYKILQESGLEYEEDESKRFLLIKNYPLKVGLYVYDSKLIDSVEVLVIIPPNYNTSGNDMFWTYPPLSRADGKQIPAAHGFGQGDPRIYKDKEFCRWSRHFKPDTWFPKVDNIQKVLSRIEWALKNPDAKR